MSWICQEIFTQMQIQTADRYGIITDRWNLGVSDTNWTSVDPETTKGFNSAQKDKAWETVQKHANRRADTC